MARVTVEDCIARIPNRFELVTLAARRAKDIAAGSPLAIDRDNDKDTVVALREIAECVVDLDVLHEEIVQTQMRNQISDRAPGASATDEIDSDVLESFASETVAIASHDDEDDDDDDEAVAKLEAAPEGISFDEQNLDVED